MQQCSRCRGELGQEGRFNHTFGGLALGMSAASCLAATEWSSAAGVRPVDCFAEVGDERRFCWASGSGTLASTDAYCERAEDSPQNPKLCLHESVSAMAQPVQQQRRTSPSKQGITRRASPFLFTPSRRKTSSTKASPSPQVQPAQQLCKWRSRAKQKPRS